MDREGPGRPGERPGRGEDSDERHDGGDFGRLFRVNRRDLRRDVHNCPLLSDSPPFAELGFDGRRRCTPVYASRQTMQELKRLKECIKLILRYKAYGKSERRISSRSVSANELRTISAPFSASGRALLQSASTRIPARRPASTPAAVSSITRHSAG